ncbi:secreted RxLR effector protein 161-like [Rutidosis leptorrhynchoides]|uniref:secreted RxLR effector protein 161-like n=1 Tax=Rutidosis leptorrhynchoides TaxID=125765 RepID=UPI003A99AD93
MKVDKDEDGIKINDTYYKQIIGSLMYLTASRPDIMFAVSLISRFMSKPTQFHLTIAKRILRYIRATQDYGIFYKRGCSSKLIGYTDSDYAGDVEDSKSTSGYVFMMCGGAVAWSSRKQPIVTLSTTKAEFVAAVSFATQAIWMQKILKEIGHEQSDGVIIMCDNNSTIQLSRNPVFNGRTKHIRVRYHWLRDLTKEGVIYLEFCGTHDQLADIMTKQIKVESFQKLRLAMGICAASSLN